MKRLVCDATQHEGTLTQCNKAIGMLGCGPYKNACKHRPGPMGEASGGIAYILQMAEQGNGGMDRALILNPVRPPFASSQREYGQIHIFGSAPRIGIDLLL